MPYFSTMRQAGHFYPDNNLKIQHAACCNRTDYLPDARFSNLALLVLLALNKPHQTDVWAFLA
jgi:hypothetical protein